MYRAYRNETEVRMKERYHAILLGMDGRSCPEISAILYCDADTIRAYARAYREGGLAALPREEPPGRPPRLGPEDKEELKKVLRQSPRAAGYERNVWTVPLVIDWLKKQRQIELKDERVRQILHALEFRMRKPRRRNRRRSEEACQEWLIEFIGELLDLLEGPEEIVLLFFDEAGLELEPTRVRRWTYTGEDVTEEDEYVYWNEPSRKAERGRVQVHAAVHPRCAPEDSPRVHFRVLAPNETTDGEQVKQTVQMVHTRYPDQRIFLLMDNAKAHRFGVFADWAAQSEQKTWLTVKPLPSYAPDLKLAEDLWHILRPRVTHNYDHGTVQKLRQAIQAACERLRRLGHKLSATVNLDRFFSQLEQMLGKEVLEQLNVYHPAQVTT